MRIALVHDYLREYGGAERVLEALHEMFPDAPVYVGVYDKKRLGANANRFAKWDVRETVLAKFPLAKSLVSPYRVFAAWAFARLDLSQFDFVISSTNMYMAKAVRVRPDAKHISYVHTPPRSLYGFSTMMDWKKNPVIRVGGELMNIWMRYVDFHSAQNPDVLIANGRTTQERIKRYYRRDSVVVYPPVAMVDAKPKVVGKKDREYLLFVGRLARSKHPELALQVAEALNVPLKVVGVGGLLEDLRARAAGAQAKIEFLGSVDDAELQQLYGGARAVLFPAEDEDFGIVPIEAHACGTPVIAHFSGEPRYTVEHQKTGWHVRSFNAEDWVAATRLALDHSWDYETIQKSAEKYSTKEFAKRIHEIMASLPVS